MNIPEGYRRLSAEEAVEIQERIWKKAGGPKRCEICDSPDWDVFPIVFSPRIILINKKKISFKEDDSNTLNQAAMVCRNCGNSKYFELHVIGFEIKNEEMI